MKRFTVFAVIFLAAFSLSACAPLLDGQIPSENFKTLSEMEENINLEIYFPQERNVRTELFGGVVAKTDFRVYYTDEKLKVQTGYRIAVSPADRAFAETAENGDVVETEFAVWNGDIIRLDGPEHYFYKQPADPIADGAEQLERSVTVDGKQIRIREAVLDGTEVAGIPVDGVGVVCAYFESQGVTYRYVRKTIGEGGEIDLSIFDGMTLLQPKGYGCR